MRALATTADGTSHALAFIGGCAGRRTVPVDVDSFGQAGSQPAVYQAYEISSEANATVALIALER